MTYAAILQENPQPFKTCYLLKEFFQEAEAMLASCHQRNTAQVAAQDQQEAVAKTGLKKTKKKALKIETKREASPQSSDEVATHVAANTSSASPSPLLSSATEHKLPDDVMCKRFSSTTCVGVVYGVDAHIDMTSRPSSLRTLSSCHVHAGIECLRMIIGGKAISQKFCCSSSNSE
ncbi:hypothetical protein MRX96_032351 [Rhipicephalus microplus]